MLQSINGRQIRALCFVLFVFAGIFPVLRNVAQAQQSPQVPPLTFKAADSNETGDGTLSPAARAAHTSGPLPASNADIDAKAAANKASDERH
jgi:hypothetical protein